MNPTRNHQEVKFVLLIAAWLLTATSTRAALYDVYARDNSSTGGNALNTISLIAGEFFSVSVDPLDLWSAGALPRWSNANGLIVKLYATGSDESGQPANTLIGDVFPFFTKNGFTAPYGALVGRIGTEYVLLGTSYTGAAPASGVLELMYWDSNNSDNTDQVAAIAALVTPIPESSTVIAGALLLLPFGASIVRRLRRTAWLNG